MKRKLVRVGKNCNMAAIPAKWLKQQELDTGDDIEIQEIENYLLVSAKPLLKEKSIKIHIKTNNKFSTVRTMQLLYDAGFNDVEITFDDSNVIHNILRGINLLNEWVIEEYSKNNCIIKSVKNVTVDFKALFRKQFISIKAYLDDYKKLLENPLESTIKDIRLRYKLILTDLMKLRRYINTSKLPSEYKYYYFIVIQFEEMIDHYEYLLREFEREKIIPNDLVKLQDKLNDLFELTYENFYKFDIEKSMEITDTIAWKWFRVNKNPIFMYHLRAVAEKIKNINKYTVGIKYS